MDGFKIKTRVNVHDVDFNGVAKASAIMRYMQTAAEEQLKAGGMAYDTLKSMNRAFILSRLHLEIDRPLKEGEPLTAVTFPSESRGFSFLRCYAVEQDGLPVARAVSVWALVAPDTHALVRVCDFELGLPLLPPLSLELPRIKLPSTLARVGGYGVHYGDVDRNLHMNNTRYPDMYCNFMPMEGKRIRSVTINYSSEARIGDKLDVYRADEEDGYYFKTVRSDGKTNSEARVVLESI